MHHTPGNTSETLSRRDFRRTVFFGFARGCGHRVTTPLSKTFRIKVGVGTCPLNLGIFCTPWALWVNCVVICGLGYWGVKVDEMNLLRLRERKAVGETARITISKR